MNYRVRLDLSFPYELDAIALIAYVKKQIAKAVSVNEGKPDAEVSFYSLEICRHDEGLLCTPLERIEIRGGKVLAVKIV